MIQGLLVIVLLLNVVAAGTSRVRVLLQVVAIQGVLLGLMPLWAGHELGVRTAILAAALVFLKGILIPGMLFRGMREVNTHREERPLLGFTASMVIVATGTGLALTLASRLPVAAEHVGSLLIPTALSTLLTGCLLIITRAKALSQVTGYLVMENGIYIFGLLLVNAMPFMVELGVLLDLFVGVFVITLVLNQINRTFASQDTRQLSTLRE